MSKTIRVKNINFNSIIFSKEAPMVTMPGASGEFRVLSGRELLIASLKEGLIKILISNNESYSLTNVSASSILRFVTFSAIAEITSTTVMIVTDFAVDVTDVPELELPAKIEFLQKKLG